MKIKIHKHQSMSHDGQYVLRSIQNNSLPNIDLLIRECIQNSLDAGISSKSGKKVEVDVRIGTCDRKKVSNIFKGLSMVLNKKFSGCTDIEYIAIKDKFTNGLTGPLKESEISSHNSFGNLRKLVYELGKPQDVEGKGGSWGIGKTVFFRVGIGLVIYYSKIRKQNGSFESRLAAALVEDNNDKLSLLRQANLCDGNVPTGIAWWGNTDKKDGSSYPITAESEINHILDIFDIPAYEDGETGTCVIIPYIDREKLEQNANPNGKLYGYTLEKLIKLAVQRWYFPRLYNNSYPYGRWLDFKVNGARIRENERQPFFKCMKVLYNAAVYRVEEKDDVLTPDIDVPDNHVIDINIRNCFSKNQLAGAVSFIHLTEQDLKMLPPNNYPIPYSLLYKDDEDDETGNLCILAYCRKAGMVINYEVQSEWIQGLPKLPEGEFLLAFFHPNVSNTLKADSTITLDEYLRKTERSDHNFWEDCQIDGKKQDIIAKIKKQVPKKILENFEETIPQESTEVDSYLGGVMGRLFMPALGYKGKRPIADGSKNKRGKDKTTVQTPDITMVLQEPNFQEDNLTTVTFNLKVRDKIKNAHIIIKAHTNKGDIAADDWERNTGESFPVEINFNTVVYNKDGNDIDFSYIKSQKNNISYGVDISVAGKDQKDIGGILVFKNNDPNVSVSIQADGKEAESL